MSGEPAPALRQVRRGDDLGELQLVCTDNRVLILYGHGLTPDERIRTSEAALKILSAMVTR